MSIPKFANFKSWVRKLRHFDICTSCSMLERERDESGVDWSCDLHKLYPIMIRTIYPATVVGGEKPLSQAQKNVSSIISIGS
jgi:hypothetical protein